jgi:Tol biopolymer transport system component
VCYAGIRASWAVIGFVSVLAQLAGGCSSTDNSSPDSNWTSPSTMSPSTRSVPTNLSGRIVFERVVSGEKSVYTVNPDGSNQHKLFGRGAEFPHWSPDGTVVSIFCCDDGMAAHFADPASGRFREIAPPDPSLEVHCGIWSTNGRAVACESYGKNNTTRDGVYSVRVSDGRGLARITAGSDAPLDYSPDGSQLLLVRDGVEPKLLVARLGSPQVDKIPTPGLTLEYGFYAGSWSPTGSVILLSAQAGPERSRGLWLVHADGTMLRRLRIAGCGAPISDPNSADCSDPGWSPDGRHLVFTMAGDLYIAKVDGGDLFQITTTADASEPDWGRPPKH